MSTYVAKFRVLTRTEKVETRYENSTPTYHPVVLVKLQPVTAKNKWAQDGSEENLVFWSATPSGECEVTLTPEDAAAYRLGQAFYIEFYPSDSGTWVLGSYTQHLSGQLDVAFYPPGWGGHFKVNVERPETVIKLREDIAPVVSAVLTAKVADVAIPAAKWEVRFTPAPG